MAPTTPHAPDMWVGASPQPDPQQGDLWYNSVSGYLFIWYDDGNTGQWVVAAPGSEPGPPGPPLVPSFRPSSGYTAKNFDAMVISTAISPMTINLTTAPADLDRIRFEPSDDSWGNPNLLLVDPQGKPINGATDVLACDVPAPFELVWYADTLSWRVLPLKGAQGEEGSLGPQGPPGKDQQSPSYTPTFTAGVYNMVAADLGKTFLITTGSGADQVINLFDPTGLGLDGSVVAFRKQDTGTAKLIIRNSDGTDNTWLQTENDYIRLRVSVNQWDATDSRVTDVVRIYNASAGSTTWTKPPRLTRARFFAVGGGGGGGSGRKGAAGTIRCGGGSGGVGAVIDRTYPAQYLQPSYTISMGTDAAGGAAISAVDTNGNPGASGGEILLVNLMRCRAGAAGSGGTNAAGGGGLSQTSSDRTPISNGAAANVAGLGASGASSGGPGTGGAGGSIPAANGTFAGGAGGQANIWAYTGSLGGTAGAAATGGAGGNGGTANDIAAPTSRPDLESGGGGGGGGSSSTGVGGNGGDGGAPGGSGGGGGASENTFNSGAGGIGKGPRLIIYELFAR